MEAVIDDGGGAGGGVPIEMRYPGVLAGNQWQLKCHHVVKGGRADVKERDGKKSKVKVRYECKTAHGF